MPVILIVEDDVFMPQYCGDEGWGFGSYRCTGDLGEDYSLILRPPRSVITDIRLKNGSWLRFELAHQAVKIPGMKNCALYYDGANS